MKHPAVLVDPGALTAGARVELAAAEWNHLRVRRVGSDAQLLVLDGGGATADAVLVGSGPVITIGSVRRVPTPATTVLAVGAGDRDRFLGLAERCTELGVTHCVPLEVARAHGVASRLREAALDKARRRAREACKQSGNAWAAIIEQPCPLAALATRHPHVRWLVAQRGAKPCGAVAAGEAIGWIIGPEGGLTDDELATAARVLAAVAAGLGPAMLRFDTAAIVAATITQDRRAT